MSDKITAQEINAAATDAQAFGLTAAFNRGEFIRGLLADPRTQVFDRRVVAWLLMSCDNLKAETRECQDKLTYLEQQLSAAPNVMPKSKALVKQAKMIARLAEAVTEVVAIQENYTDGTQTDSDAFEALLLRLGEWEDKHDALIEVCRDE